MHARVSTYRFPPDMVETAIGQFDSAMAEPGFEPEEVLFLVDRSSGKGMTITFWQDEEAAVASREAANRLRSGATESAAGSIESVEEFEVALRR